MVMLSIHGVRYTVQDALDKGLIRAADVDALVAITPTVGSITVPQVVLDAPALAKAAVEVATQGSEVAEAQEAADGEEPEAAAEEAAPVMSAEAVSAPVHRGRRTARNN